VIDLEQYLEKRLRVKLAGGREGACRRARLAPLAARRARRARRAGATPPPAAPSLTAAPARAPLPPAPVVGTLKGFDGLVNIVLDDCVETLRDPADLSRAADPPATRALGLVVCRGTAVTVVVPDDGFEAIDNPFADAGDDGAMAAEEAAQ